MMARGSALMLVLGALILMSVTVMGTVEFMRYSNAENGRANQEFIALSLAESGITLGLHPQIKPGDPVLRQEVGTDSGFEVLITSEGSRIAINYLTDERYREIIYNLFILWDLPPEQANVAVDSLADWIDSDDDLRSQGAETDYYESRGYAGFPRQQGFTTLEEMLLARGMDAVERVKPDWRNYFSIHGDGLIDLNNAPADILQAVANAEESEAANLIRERSGADGISGTEDDVILSTAQAQQFLGMDEAEATALSAIVTTEHLTRRVESTGRVGEQRYKIVVIARLQDDGSLNYLARTEE
jgi:type II secretory pathway component PulK